MDICLSPRLLALYSPEKSYQQKLYYCCRVLAELSREGVSADIDAAMLPCRLVCRQRLSYVIAAARPGNYARQAFHLGPAVERAHAHKRTPLCRRDNTMPIGHAAGFSCHRCCTKSCRRFTTGVEDMIAFAQPDYSHFGELDTFSAFRYCRASPRFDYLGHFI